MQKVGPCLWFNGQAEEAAHFYVSIFKNSRILGISRYQDVKGLPQPAGSVMTVRFVLDGEEFVGLNGGPQFPFSPAISFVASAESQAEVDHLWQALSAGGQEGQCGWLTDKYGVSWQIVPTGLMDMLSKTDNAAAQRAIAAMLQMKKLDVAVLRQAYNNA